MLEHYKSVIAKADDSKKAVRAIGLINAVRSDSELDDYQRLDRVNEIVEAYNYHNQQKWSVTAEKGEQA